MKPLRYIEVQYKFEYSNERFSCDVEFNVNLGKGFLFIRDAWGRRLCVLLVYAAFLFSLTLPTV